MNWNKDGSKSLLAEKKKGDQINTFKPTNSIEAMIQPSILRNDYLHQKPP